MAIILASQSPRRQQLLRQMGLSFTVKTADIDETMNPFSPAQWEVARLSREKAEAVRVSCKDDDVIIAADTIVVIDDRVLGKPHDRQEAEAMLRELSGREHQVMTGLTVLQGEQAETHVETARIRFRSLEEEELQAYLDSGEPMDKAGAYGIQGLAAMFITGITGDYYTVMGLPVCRLTQILREFSVPVLTGGREKVEEV